jgi:hypothetical protein
MTTIPERLAAAKDRTYDMTAAVITDPDYRVTDDIQRIIQSSDNPGMDLVDLAGTSIAFLAEALKTIHGDSPSALRKLQEVSLQWEVKVLLAGGGA